jgi:hypothetical protein
VNAYSGRTEPGTPVGTATGVVHLLHAAWFNGARGICGRELPGDLVDRTGDGPTCQRCIDERDMSTALVAGFDHDVYARRVALGLGPSSWSGMRYGAEVRCFGCVDDNGRPTTLWSSNEPGQRRKAEKIARDHFLAAYREHLAQTDPS